MTDTITEFLDRSSWGVLPAHPTLVLVLLLGAALAATAGTGRASWRDERGQAWIPAVIGGLVVAVVVLAVIVLT